MLCLSSFFFELLSPPGSLGSISTRLLNSLLVFFRGWNNLWFLLQTSSARKCFLRLDLVQEIRSSNKIVCQSKSFHSSIMLLITSLTFKTRCNMNASIQSLNIGESTAKLSSLGFKITTREKKKELSSSADKRFYLKHQSGCLKILFPPFFPPSTL